MKNAAAIAILLASTGAVWAQSDGAELANLGFESADLNSNGTVSRDEMMEQGDNIFVSMDSDDDGNLSFDEFFGWDFGFKNLAEEKGREQAYETALKMVFNIWDRDANGFVTSIEQRAGVARDFVRNDLDGDYALSRPEFLGGFLINVALRTALKDE